MGENPRGQGFAAVELLHFKELVGPALVADEMWILPASHLR